MIHLLDLDNCISNDGWRIPFINFEEKHPDKRYHQYHMLSAFDEFCNRQVCGVPGTTIIILTARPEVYRNVTEKWLEKNGVNWDMLLMRDDGDHRHSVDLKRAMLERLYTLGVRRSAIVKAWDDREDIVEMYKSQGIDAGVVKCHNVSSYAPEHAIRKDAAA